ncbi:MAG: hypothetical protein IKH82_01775 [Clostridiales bacterium]|nr:hypothetical protein [Clostridiales bacterium]MBR6986782.1 hypothetical protein [Clostridiales bacterium]
MAITDKIEDIKTSLKKISKDLSYKKANKERDKKVEAQASIMKCRGQLGASLNDFRRNIRSHVDYLKAGPHSEVDVSIREQLLWDAAISYMLVRDAISALETVTSSVNIDYSYKLLDTAVALMNGKKKKIPSYNGAATKGRVRYDYVKSDAVLKAKTQILESVFEDLKKTGDIEACLAATENKDNAGLYGLNGDIDKTSPEYLKSIANGSTPAAGDADLNVDDIDFKL